MSTAIEWTDETWNPTGGCDRISPGCAHCYAKEQWDRRHKAFLEGKAMAPQYSKPFEVLQLFPDRLLQPLKWRQPRRVFVNSVSDLFHEDVPVEFIDKVFAVMALPGASTSAEGRYRPHTFQILTKRADRMRDYMANPQRSSLVQMAAGKIVYEHKRTWGTPYTWPLPNVWLGVSVENQRFADERIPLLLQTPAAVRFISAEPLLGPVDIRPYMPNALWNDIPSWKEPELGWVIVGGESGQGARPFDLAWARSIVVQCKAAGVPVFVKQIGSGVSLHTLEKGRGRFVNDGDFDCMKIRDLKGGDMDEWPADLRVREFPEARA